MARSRRDDDDDDRPRKRSRSRRDEDDDDDEDEDEEAPRKKRKMIRRSRKASGGGGATLLILGLVGVAVLMLGGGGFAVWFFVFNDTPEKAFEDLKDAFIKRDYGRIYDRLDKEAQAEFENMKPNPFLKATQSGKKGRELYIEILKETEGMTAALGINRAEQEQKYKDTKVESVTVDGDNATLTTRGPFGSTTVKMVKQDGRWRVKTAGQPAFRGR